MKKLLLTLAAACIAFTLTGCSNTTSTEDYLNSNKGSGTYHPIIKTENGYYYNYNPRIDQLSGYMGSLALKYHDNATGDDIYLCAKPECTHNGNDFCTATNNLFIVWYMGMYENNIYIAGMDGRAFKLLKTSLDGTELSEVCTVDQTIGNSDSGFILYFDDTRAMILHRGYAFIPYVFMYFGMADTQTAGLAIVNLSDGSVQLMPEYEHENLIQAYHYTNVIPYGDYIYYTMAKTEFHRYNFKTGEDEILPFKESLAETYGNKFSKKIKEFDTYTIIDGKVWYLCGGTKKVKSSMFIYDPDENTTTLVEGFGEQLLSETTTYDYKGEPYAVSTNYCISPQPMYDGKYLYIVGQGFFAGTLVGGRFLANESDYYDMDVHIFTLEGERLGGFVFPRKGSCQINVVDETFYIQTKEGVVCCPVADVIAGNIEWKELYLFGDSK